MTANISESIFIRGELVAEEDLTVQGSVEGRIDLQDHNLWIDLSAEVRADVYAKNVFVAGNVVGSIFAHGLVEIKQSGCVQGNIHCHRIALMDGAKFMGRLEKTKDPTMGPGLPRAQAATIGQGSP